MLLLMPFLVELFGFGERFDFRNLILNVVVQSEVCLMFRYVSLWEDGTHKLSSVELAYLWSPFNVA